MFVVLLRIIASSQRCKGWLKWLSYIRNMSIIQMCISRRFIKFTSSPSRLTADNTSWISWSTSLSTCIWYIWNIYVCIITMTRWRLKSPALTVYSGAGQRKKSKLRITGLCVGNSPVTGEFPEKSSLTRKMFPFDDVIMCVEPYIMLGTLEHNHVLLKSSFSISTLVRTQKLAYLAMEG